jgi:hypothetical protein
MNGPFLILTRLVPLFSLHLQLYPSKLAMEATWKRLPSMRHLWQTIKSYIFWTHERGSFHYDVMVSLILLFIFVTPRSWFRDKPVEHRPHQSEVVVQPDGHNGLIYEVDAVAVSGKSDEEIRADLLRVIEPISGEIEIASYQAVRDSKGHIFMYTVRVQR